MDKSGKFSHSFLNQQARHHYEIKDLPIYSSMRQIPHCLHEAQKRVLIVHWFKTPASPISMFQSNLKRFIESRVNGVYIEVGHATLFLAVKTGPAKKKTRQYSQHGAMAMQHKHKHTKNEKVLMMVVNPFFFLQPNCHLTIINTTILEKIKLKEVNWTF